MPGGRTYYRVWEREGGFLHQLSYRTGNCFQTQARLPRMQNPNQAAAIDKTPGIWNNLLHVSVEMIQKIGSQKQLNPPLILSSFFALWSLAISPYRYLQKQLYLSVQQKDWEYDDCKRFWSSLGTERYYQTKNSNINILQD